MDVRVGTSGYAYKEWKGLFYPEDLPQGRFLEHYATRLRTVEINNTFYRMPKRDVVRAWAEAAPDGFSFVLKASMRITHKKKLEDCEEELGFLARSAAELGGKQGPLLFQLPPWLRKGTARLSAFLAVLPEGMRAAVEFRHASWFDEEVYAVLREHGAALVWADGEDGEPPLVGTAPFGYVRLHRPAYDDDALAAWAERIAGGPFETVHVFFKHETDGAGPLLAEAFAKRF